MNEEKVKIIEASYDIDKNMAKLKVEKMDTGKQVTWALTGDSFDSLIGQITGKALKYHPEQRTMLCENILGIGFVNSIQVDIDNPDIDAAKEKSIAELQHNHDAVDRYPFYEIQQEAIEEAMKESQEEQNES